MKYIVRTLDAAPTIPQVKERLRLHGLRPGSTRSFDALTRSAVRAFQSARADAVGAPLRVDGVVGPATWWALEQDHSARTAVSFTLARALQMPTVGGTRRGRAALTVAIQELEARCGERGGDNRGPDVQRYLNGMAPEGSSWCAGFVSWCFAQNEQDRERNVFGFPYAVGARALFGSLPAAQRFGADGTRLPEPGDLICWARGNPKTGWKGHIGIVHSYLGGVVRTIEGNRTPLVDTFNYRLLSLGQTSTFLGFGRVEG